MPPYHSQIADENITGKVVGNTPFLPLKVTKKVCGHTTTVTRGVVPTPPGDDTDIVDEVLDLFKANIFFSTYEVKGKADRILIYCTLYVILCLKKLAKCPNSAKAVQDMYTLALQRFAVPGDADFPLNAFYERPKSASETEEMRKYFTQLRVEVGYRLIERVFDPNMTGGDDKPSKWWICFSRRKFLNLALSK